MAQVGGSAVLTPTIGLRRVAIATGVGLFAIVAIVAVLLLFGFTSPPFEVRGEMAFGKVENGVGTQYTLTASRLTATWTLDRDAGAVFRFGGGSASVDGRALRPGCYSGTIGSGTVISLSDATDVAFVTPETDSTCAALP